MSENKLFRPMLANPADFSILRWPVYASRKIDGLRGTIHDQIMSRSMKPLPNKWLRDWAYPLIHRSIGSLRGLDGEFIVGSPTAPDVFRTSTSHIMSDDKQDFDFKFYVFDMHSLHGWDFAARLDYLRRQVKEIGDPRVILLDTQMVFSEAELNDYEAAALEEGYEGVMVRSPMGLYKNGRATARGQELLKVKRHEDMEAVVIALEERMHNGNEGFTNEIGRTARSSAQAGKTGMGTLGALTVRGLNGPFKDVEFSVGTGLDDAERARLWVTPGVVGSIVKVKYFPVGSKEKPRHPVYQGMRDARDMDDSENPVTRSLLDPVIGALAGVISNPPHY